VRLLLIASLSTLSLSAQPAPSFEVASIKPHVQGSGYVPLACANGRLTSVGLPLVYIIDWAYDLNSDQSRQIAEHLPTWLSPTTAFDIEAKSETPVPESQCRLMLQDLLATRFKFAAHWESKEAKVYDLVIAKGGPKMQKASDTDQGRGFNITLNGKAMQTAPGGTAPKGRTMPDFAQFLTAFNRNQPVTDKTGLDGLYKIDLKFSIQPANSTELFADPDLETALQQQLGLKLEPRKGSVSLLIVDRIEPPTAN
jgi:uncharacterized protein (TIGR03435 family)